MDFAQQTRKLCASSAGWHLLLVVEAGALAELPVYDGAKEAGGMHERVSHCRTMACCRRPWKVVIAVLTVVTVNARRLERRVQHQRGCRGPYNMA